jgi:hypothetical protein
MKRNLLLSVFLLWGAAVFAKEIFVSGFEYVYEIEGQADIKHVFEIIKSTIPEYGHYNCGIVNADKQNKDLSILTTKIMDHPQYRESAVLCCEFYLDGKVLRIFFARDEIFGFTQPYNKTEYEEVYNRIYNLAKNNMKSIR